MHHIKTARLLDGATEIDPFTNLPVIRGASRTEGTGQGSDQLAIRLGVRRGEDGDFVPQTSEFAGKQPNQSFDAAGVVLPDWALHGGNLCYAHRRPFVLAHSRPTG